MVTATFLDICWESWRKPLHRLVTGSPLMRTSKPKHHKNCSTEREREQQQQQQKDRNISLLLDAGIWKLVENIRTSKWRRRARRGWVQTSNCLQHACVAWRLRLSTARSLRSDAWATMCTLLLLTALPPSSLSCCFLVCVFVWVVSLPPSLPFLTLGNANCACQRLWRSVGGWGGEFCHLAKQRKNLKNWQCQGFCGEKNSYKFAIFSGKIKLKSPHLPKTCLWKISNKTHRWRTNAMHDRKEEELTGDPSISQIKKNSNMQAWIDEVQEAPVNPPQLPKKKKKKSPMEGHQMQFVQQGHDFHRPLAVVPAPPAPPSTPAVGADFNSWPKDVIFDGTHLLCSTVFVRDSSYSSGCRVWQPCMSSADWYSQESVLEDFRKILLVWERNSFVAHCNCFSLLCKGKRGGEIQYW